MIVLQKVLLKCGWCPCPYMKIPIKKVFTGNPLFVASLSNFQDNVHEARRRGATTLPIRGLHSFAYSFKTTLACSYFG